MRVIRTGPSARSSASTPMITPVMWRGWHWAEFYQGTSKQREGAGRSPMSESIELAFRPVQQLTVIGDDRTHVWRAIGNDPAFACIGAESVPAGWYELELDMEVAKGRVCNPCLYPDYGAGSFEYHKIDLPVDVKSGERFKGNMTVMFVQDLKALRFDPTVIPAE